MTASFDAVPAKTILSGEPTWVTPEMMESLTEHPLECVETEFPHVVGSVSSPEEQIQPSDDHPIFYGCYDWHSAVHSHWNLIRQLRIFDDHPKQEEISVSIDRRFIDEKVEREIEYLRSHPTFEKPYGWGWLLRLAAELSLWDDSPGKTWRKVLKPLETEIVRLVKEKFLSEERPFRVGTHHNTAFTLQSVIDYARVTSNPTLGAEARSVAIRFFENDNNAPVDYEPLGWDFLSPSLVEADLMRRILKRDEFLDWIDEFFPDLTTAPYETILDPVEVDADPDEEIALHLVGLNLSKAWCMAGIGSALTEHPYMDLLQDSAVRHVECSFDLAFTDKYAGSHWLSTFVLYLITRNAGGIAPE